MFVSEIHGAFDNEFLSFLDGKPRIYEINTQICLHSYQKYFWVF